MSDSHEWCRDTARDEAVRAAEDAAAVPSIMHRDLPEQVALLWASVTDILGRVVRIEGEMDAGEAEEAAPACDQASPVEGLRTERVTLEVTHDCLYPAAEWVLEAVQERFDGPAESVRVVEEADTVSDEAVAHGVTLRALAETRESLAAANRGIARLAAERDAARAKAERLRARVAELEAAPAAGGEAKQDPVAWGVLSAGEIVQVSLLPWRDSSVLWSQRSGGTVVPLYAAPVAESATTPPEPRGWLTAEEREAVLAARDYFAAPEHDDDECAELRACALRALLARSSPPRVKVPHLDDLEEAERPVWESACKAWIDAIRAAGGEVDE